MVAEDHGTTEATEDEEDTTTTSDETTETSEITEIETEIGVGIEIGTETVIGTVRTDTAMTVGGTTAMTGGMIDVKTAGAHVLVSVGNATDNPQHLLALLCRMTRHQPHRQ